MSFDEFDEDEYTVQSADPENAFLDPRARRLWSLVGDNIKIPSPSTFFFNCMSVVAMAGATTLGRVMLAFHNVKFHNIETYRRLVEERPLERPLITVSNHQATLDDPLLFSALTSAIGQKWAPKQRWTVGASELCYANIVIGTFCRLCKVLPVSRGEGIWQPMMDDVVGRLSKAEGGDNWVHIFPEGRVHQDPSGELLRFKWGVGRLVADPDVTPLVLPIFIEGTKAILDEKRKNRRIPSSLYGTDVIIRIGEPIDFSEYVARAKEEAKKKGEGNVDRIATYKDITSIIQTSIEKLRDSNVL